MATTKTGLTTESVFRRVYGETAERMGDVASAWAEGRDGVSIYKTNGENKRELWLDVISDNELLRNLGAAAFLEVFTAPDTIRDLEEGTRYAFRTQTVVLGSTFLDFRDPLDYYLHFRLGNRDGRRARSERMSLCSTITDKARSLGALEQDPDWWARAPDMKVARISRSTVDIGSVQRLETDLQQFVSKTIILGQIVVPRAVE